MSDGDNGSWLVRKAMRRREEERDESEERWVCYSEVTSYCNSTSSGGGAASAMDREPLLWFDEEKGKSSDNTTAFRVLSLKLDYEGILNAWSDKGSLYVLPETPQTVPDLHNNAANVIFLSSCPFFLEFLYKHNMKNWIYLFIFHMLAMKFYLHKQHTKYYYMSFFS